MILKKYQVKATKADYLVKTRDSVGWKSRRVRGGVSLLIDQRQSGAGLAKSNEALE